MQLQQLKDDRINVLISPKALTNLLDRIYLLSGILSALCLASICLMIVYQVSGRLLDRLALFLGLSPPGVAIPSMAEIAGFFLVAATFLGLGYTFKAKAHIRVSLLLQQLKTPIRKWVEVWCLLVAFSVTSYFTWYAAILAIDSYRFAEVSLGMLPIPLWVPQSTMVLGLSVMAIGILDSLIRIIAGYTDVDEHTQFE